MIRALIFDIGNVLLRFDFGLAITRIERHCGKSLNGITDELEPLKVEYEGGQIGRAQFVKRALEILEYRIEEADFVTAWQEIFVENTPMTKVVERLHGLYPLYLLSNTSDIHSDYFLKQYPVFNLFADAVFSHVAGCSKPGHAIYEIAARQFGVLPGHAVFIDDLPANIAAAREVGYQTIQYDHRHHDRLLEELARLGVMPNPVD